MPKTFQKITINGISYSTEELLQYINAIQQENKDLNDLLKSIEEDGTVEHNNAIKLREENVELKSTCERWARDWSYQNENIKSLIAQKDELWKEINGLRHLKKENVELIERLKNISSEKLEKEGNSCGITFNEAKTQIIQNDYKKCAEERDEYKHQLNAANKMIEALKNDKKYWKEQYLEFSDLKNDFDDIKKENEIFKKEAEDSKKCTVGWRESYDKAVAEKDELLKKNRELRVIAENLESKLRNTQDEMYYKFDYINMNKLQKKIDVLKKERDEYKHQLNVLDKENKELKETLKLREQEIVDYVFEKDDEIQELKKLHEIRTEKYYVCNHCGYKIAHNTNQWGGCGCCKDGLMIEREEEQKHPMYPIHWGGLDLDIHKQAKEQSIEEVVDALKGIKSQGFEDYDPSDFEQPIKEEQSIEEIVKDTLSKVTNSENYKNKVKEEKQKQVEFSAEELLKRVTEYADTLDSLPKSFPVEFQDEETTAENLEEKFDKGEDVLDFFEKPTWKCPCNKYKETKTEKSWEETASDLALKVTKLEEIIETQLKQIEEIKAFGNKLTKMTYHDSYYEYFKKHGKWPW